MKTIGISLITLMLGACTMGDTLVKRGGNNEDYKDWSVEQTFKWNE